MVVDQKHIDPDELQLYAFDAGGHSHNAAVEEHVLSCAPCRERLMVNLRVIGAMTTSLRAMRWIPAAKPAG